MPLGGEGWPAAEMLEKPGNVKKPERTPTLNIENKAIPSQQLRQLLKTAGCSGAAVGGTAIALPSSTGVVSGGPLPDLPQRRAVRPVSPPRPSLERPWRHKASEALRSGDQRRQPAGLRNAHPWIA